MNKLGRRLASLLTMVVGGALVFALLYMMNELGDKPEKEAPKVARDFKVERENKKPPQQRPQPKKRVVRKTQTTRRAPAPNITTALSGLSFDLPQFEGVDLAAGSDQLLAGGEGGNLLMTADSVDTKPVPRMRKTPEYPNKARTRGITGFVLLKIKVSERGDVERVRVVDAQPTGVFEDVAIAAVQQWTFDPATYKGQPVATEVAQKIPFLLN